MNIPDRLYIETTNLCNARCVFCMYPKIHGTFPIEYMEKSLFENVVNDYINMGGREISLTPTVADPFTDKYFAERDCSFGPANLRHNERMEIDFNPDWTVRKYVTIPLDYIPPKPISEKKP